MSYSPLNPPRRLLYGPGPTMVDSRVYEAMRQPVVGLMDPYFFEVVRDTQAMLRTVFGTANEFTMVMSGTGSSGMETAVSNFVEPGSRFAVFVNGFFGERLAEMGRRLGAEVVRCEKPWGEIFNEGEAAEFLRRERPQVVAFVQAETSTGAFQSGQAIVHAAREIGALTIADCVTSLGGVPVNLDHNGIDIAYSCSQKGLSAPPGLAPISVSPRALERLSARKSTNLEWYLDLRLLKDYYFAETPKYHHTPPCSMFYALREGLRVILEEGLENRFARHRRNHLALVAGIEALGLSMHVEADHRIWTLNTPRVPEGINDLAVRRRLMANYGIEILGGFGPLAGKVFRIGLMGPLSTEEGTLFFLDAFEKCLAAEGYGPPASAVNAASQFYSAETARA